MASVAYSTNFAVLQELGLSQDAVLIGLTGGYHPVKGHANFLRAAGQLLQRRPEVRFILCGKGIANDNAALRTLVEEKQRRGRIPNVVGEAMSAGVPCIVTAVSDRRRSSARLDA